jgi:DNA primase
MSASEVQQLVSQYLGFLKRTGNENVMAVCPFHMGKGGGREKNPSFCLSLRSGLWVCFSCKEKGNLSTLLDRVGADYGTIQLNQRVIEEAAKNVPQKFDAVRAPIISEDPIPNELLGLFDQTPLDLIDAGFTEETIQYFDVGFDELHRRITYPLRDIRGNLIGINGRSIDADEKRYKVYDVEYQDWGLDYREAPRKVHLWNAHRVYPKAMSCTPPRYVALTEGHKAAMWLYQCGIPDPLALLGSFMSDPQKSILERMGVPVFVMLDNDEAGAKALPFIARSLSRSIETYVVDYGVGGDQPDTVSPQEVMRAFQDARPFHLWAIQGGHECLLEKIRLRALR